VTNVPLTDDNLVEYNPFEAATREDPYAIYRRLRDAPTLFRSDEHEFVALSRFDEVQGAARNREVFANAPGVDLAGFTGSFGDGDFLDVDPPQHTELRALVKGFFTPKAVAELRGATEAEARALLEPLLGAGVVDIVPAFTHELPIRVVARLLGISAHDRDAVFDAVARVIDRPPGETKPSQSAVAGLRELRGYAAELLTSSKPAAGSISDALAAALREGRVTPDAAGGIFTLLAVAGHETTASLLGHAVWLLGSHPDQRAALRQDPALIPAAVEEVVRFESPIQQLARSTTLEAGSRVVLLYGSANRDERRFERADRFDISRPRIRNLAFGEGIHHCLGAPVARLEGAIALAELLRSSPDYAVVSQPVRTQSPDSRGVAELLVELRSDG